MKIQPTPVVVGVSASLLLIIGFLAYHALRLLRLVLPIGTLLLSALIGKALWGPGFTTGPDGFITQMVIFIALTVVAYALLFGAMAALATTVVGRFLGDEG